MADGVEVKIGGMSEEQVALALADKFATMNTTGEEYLANYRRCLKVVRNPWKDDN